MKCMVTGAAGFIGSHLCEHLLNSGHSVTGLDALNPYYPREMKERNLAAARSHASFTFHALDLRTDDVAPHLASVEVVFHLAAMPGLVRSWTDFDEYWTCNAQGTQRLLESLCRNGDRNLRLVYASTSSVYGRFASGDESLPTKPISPYGLTKLAGEHLCRAYGEAHGLHYVILRYFSVYGPRQRPDMGYHRFARALLRDEVIPIYGDGRQVRGNTYVDDCVRATAAAVQARAGEVYNVGGGETATLWDILHKLEALAGRPARVRQEPERTGDQRYTFADTSRIRRDLGWEPRVPLDSGLAHQWDWHRKEEQAAGS